MEISILPKPRLLALFLFIILALSFLWCMIDNIRYSVQLAQTETIIQVSTNTILTGYFWLIGHGIHGAAVIILPLMLWLRKST